MSEQHALRCPVCHSNAVHKVIDAVDYTVTREHFPVWQCANCSLRFTADAPAQEQIGRYYQSEAYISHSDTSKGLVNWLYLRVRKFTLSSKRKFIERVTGKRKGTLLDVGAGTGAFVHAMTAAGWQAEGVEPDAQAIQRALDTYKLRLLPAGQFFQLPDNRYDAVTLWHVLEHVHDLHGYVKKLRALCRPGGKIVIAVPNYTSYDALHYEAFWAAYDVPRHLYHFSPASMQALMQKHGCRIESIHPMWFDSFYVSLLSEKYQRGHSSILRGFWNGLRSNLKALSNRRLASSLIYVISAVK